MTLNFIVNGKPVTLETEPDRRLLDILRHFILFQTSEGKLVKLCPRYQQYRAVQKAMARLATPLARCKAVWICSGCIMAAC